MPRLRDLGLPELTPQVLTSLTAQGVSTLEDYLVRGAAVAFPEDGPEQWTKMSVDGALKGHLEASGLAPPAVNGGRLMEDLRDRSHMVPTGCVSLDTLLNGGLREGQLVELAGGPGSGKTQLCLRLAAEAALSGRRVLYIDTTASFSAGRLAALCEGAVIAREAMGESVPGVPWLLSKVSRLPARDVYEVLAALGAADEALGRNDADAYGVIILDSGSSVLSPVLGAGPHSQGHALVSCLGMALKRVAAERHVAVLVTNHTVRGGSWGGGGGGGGGGYALGTDGDAGDLKPALGEVWRPQAHVRVLLTRPPDPGVPPLPGAAGAGEAARRATLKAFHIGPCEKTAGIVIGEWEIRGADVGDAGM